AATATLLRFMYASPYRDPWVGSLPLGGVDGSLFDRFTKPPLSGMVRAKAGRVAGVEALAGYILPSPKNASGRQPEPAAFAIFMNNAGMTHAAAAEMVDQ